MRIRDKEHDWDVPSEDTADEHLQYARGYLTDIDNAPYLATAAMSLKFVPRPDISTMAVDSSWRLLYNPDKIIYWPVEALAAVMEHELWHLLRDHHQRGRENDIDDATKLRWNYAADAEIHSDDELIRRIEKSSGADLLATPGKLGLPKNKNVEWYFTMLEGSIPDEPQIRYKLKCGHEGTAGAIYPETEASGSSGALEDYEDDPSDEVVNSAEIEYIKKRVAEDIRKYIIDGRGRRKVGFNVENWSSETLSEGVVDWRDLFESAIYEAIDYVSGDTEPTWNRLSRRQGASPYIVLPGVSSPSPKISIVIDSSGSMFIKHERSKTLLLAAVAEINSILSEHEIGGVNVFVTDASVRYGEEIYDIDEMDIVGGGGTDMRVGIEAALESEIEPDIVIVLTDGETPWPVDNISDSLFIVGIVGNTNAVVPGWVDSVIYIDEL